MGTALQTVLALTALAFASCASGDSIFARKLLGKWRSTDGRQVAEYVFAPDGTFTGRVVGSDGAIVSSFEGKWALRKGTIHYEYTRDLMGRIPVGTLDRDKLLAPPEDHYMIEAADGSRRKYVRIR